MTTREAVREAITRYVAISTGDNLGSGVVLVSGIVMTCFHCLHTGDEIAVDGVPAEVLYVDQANDLILLAVPTAEMKMVKLGVAELGEVVITVGNPLGFSGTLLFGRVCFLSSTKVMHDTHSQPGVSGSGLFNLDGELVGLNSRVCGVENHGSWLAIAVPTEQMKNILSKAFSIVQPTPDEIQEYGHAD